MLEFSSEKPKKNKSNSSLILFMVSLLSVGLMLFIEIVIVKRRSSLQIKISARRHVLQMHFDMLHQRSCLISDCPGRTLTGVENLTCGQVNPCMDVDVEDDARIPHSYLKNILFIFPIIRPRLSRVSQTCACASGSRSANNPPRTRTHTPPSLL